jgi:hypothetical protein
MTQLLTLGAVAEHFGVQLWMVQKVYEQRARKGEPLPVRQRAGLMRLVGKSDLPKIKAALVEAGRIDPHGSTRKDAT